ncbi:MULTISPECIES: type IV secretory system conjugative DNA transfer family protein [unclassified Streptomyces]|uniref:type IV secretory system conjugative DNA transfer family protein n=1 Tax=unclassified Streptomyces TaxID=2593676 RepID=UPI00081E1221|nr:MULTISPECIES: type IV secretory system conjugative DNA transfer family protein [unclassified Streptomyces]MYZ33638.1 type IV secretory system conjugative DNA transfer family protein [Streptomyces sp. SID4917]SCF60592.1 Type IV secretory pathway, VirD4 component, TraG/TraD family ATPase [Streptomyces sp. MnatMP-M17]
MAGGANRFGGLDDNTLLAAYGAGLAAALGGAVLAAGPLSGALSGRGWASSDESIPTTVLTALVRGPGAVYHPAPPAWLFYVLVALIVVMLLTLVVKAVSALNYGGSSTGGAQWGGPKIERKLAAPQDPLKRANRITAGRGKRTKKIVAAQPNISATVFGVPGSSKTTGLVLPNAAEWQGPLVVTTTKAADLDIIYARRRQMGPVWVIAPAGIPGRPTQRWSPVDYCVDAKAADRMASWMAEASSSGDDKRAAPWIDQAKNVLKGVLLAANLSGGGINAMRRWLGLGKDAVDHVRAVLLQRGYTEVADDYTSPWLRLHEDGIGSIQFSLNVLARVYADEEVRETCASTDFTVEDLLDQNGTVCLIASEADAERFAPLLTSIIASIIHGAEVRYNTTGKPLDPSLGVLVDEAGNMLRYPRLPNILTTGRGMGIDVLTVWHDLSQLRERLGTQKANTVLSASGLRMLLPGCGDLETLRYFSGLYGRTEVERTSYGRSRGEHSTNTSLTETDLAPVHSLQQLPDFTAIAQYSNLPPIKVKMRLTFRDKDLKKLLAAPALPPADKTSPETPPELATKGIDHV